ncbi:hypothetical protein B0H17DRAFT_528994 [Mycena rosella]|uniref:Uncharacterized protein n=1 Tax=Mycena rosella TaxID=1033263 RepID=A0AAD7GYA6_MYCRO|nr:hypothetical protein B0H17DRAFT_528994 [Mycena rosella]
MDIFQTFPVPAEGFTPVFKSEDYHINPAETLLTMPESLANPMHDSHSPALSFDFPSHTFPETNSTQSYYNTTLDNLMIDPLLLSLSTPPTFPGSIDTSASGSNFSESGCPSLAGSPGPSSVSSYSFGPMTPTETGWNGDAGVGVYSPGDENRGTEAESSARPSAAGKGKKRDFSDLTGWTDAEKEALSFLEVLSKTKAGTLGKGKGKAIADEDSSSQDGLRTPGDDGGKEGQDDGFSRLRTLRIVGSLTKADTLKRAKERREELNLEIAKTRIALWETTIEVCRRQRHDHELSEAFGLQLGAMETACRLVHASDQHDEFTVLLVGPRNIARRWIERDRRTHVAHLAHHPHHVPLVLRLFPREMGIQCRTLGLVPWWGRRGGAASTMFTPRSIAPVNSRVERQLWLQQAQSAAT